MRQIMSTHRKLNRRVEMPDHNHNNGRSRRGFAAMDAEKQREIASKGGRAAHEKGTAHEFSADEAREAGRKGGTTVSRDLEHMAEIGRRGGTAASDGRGQMRQGEERETAI